jgi:hypothetical protein
MNAHALSIPLTMHVGEFDAVGNAATVVSDSALTNALF